MMIAPDYFPIWEWMFARERARKSPGASRDEIIDTYRFCNVRREDDRGTIWIRKNIRERFAGHTHLWFMLCIARQINWPDTLAELINNNAWPSNNAFHPAMITRRLNARKQRGEKVYTGAYMISAPSTKGADKQAYIAETVCGALWHRREEIYQYLSKSPSLQGIHRLLKDSKGWGNFMSYQAVVDMRFTPILESAIDVNSWAAAGPGTIRGLNRVHGRLLNFALSQENALIEIQEIFNLAYAFTAIERVDFSDIPNVLCETDKYLRVKNNEGRPRAKYVQGRGY